MYLSVRASCNWPSSFSCRAMVSTKTVLRERDVVRDKQSKSRILFAESSAAIILSRSMPDVKAARVARKGNSPNSNSIRSFWTYIQLSILDTRGSSQTVSIHSIWNFSALVLLRNAYLDSQSNDAWSSLSRGWKRMIAIANGGIHRAHGIDLVKHSLTTLHRYSTILPSSLNNHGLFVQHKRSN